MTRELTTLRDLEKLFNYLLIATDGDVDQALRQMEALNTRYGFFDEGTGAADFRERLLDEGVIEADERGRPVLTRKGERGIRKSALDRIHSEHPDADLAWVPLDLTSLKSVEAAAEVVRREPRLDVLINNAGVMVPPKTLTEDGFELQFGVNHLGHFALTGHLLEKLAATPGARVVNVSSGAHRRGRIDFDDPHAAIFEGMSPVAVSTRHRNQPCRYFRSRTEN